MAVAVPKSHPDREPRGGSHRMRRPLIGLTAYAQQVQYGSNDVMAGMLPLTYVRAVHATRGPAVLVTPHDPHTHVLQALGGIVFPGGGGGAPADWGGPRHPGN